MPNTTADQNLLFGILALQMDFISRDQLVEGMNAWVLDKQRSLAAVFVERNLLSSDRKSLLEALVQEHLKQHQGDPQKSLAALSTVDTSLQRQLEDISDSEITASLRQLMVTQLSPRNPAETAMVSVGFPPEAATRFRILRPHARGGLGQVSIAYDYELDREVALKEIQPQHANCPESRRRFLLEAEVTGHLEHPGIVPIYGMGTYGDGRPYYAMRFIAGDSLKKAIQRFQECLLSRQDFDQELELNQLLGRFLDVCDAMAFAHSRGILHRDLKPGNIMLGQFGETLVVDWGLAKKVNQLEDAPTRGVPSGDVDWMSGETLPGSAVGTPQYMSPEQATGDMENLGPLTDVYSLGAILFEIVTGTPPHAGENAMECLAAASRNEIVSTDHTGELIDIAHRAMSTQLSDRYPSVEELSWAVRAYLTHRDSITLLTTAEADLKQAKQTGDYETFAKARFGFEEALKLWDGNPRARSRLEETRTAYAQCALAKTDLDLALSLLDPALPGHSEIWADVTRSMQERDAHQKRLKSAKRTGLALAVLLFVVVSGAAIWINNERAAAVDAKDEAVDSKLKEEVARKEAEKAQNLEAYMRKRAEDVLERERWIKNEVEEQRRLAIKRQKEAEAQSIVASLNSIIADEQKQLVEAAAEAERIALIKEQTALMQERIQRERAEIERQRAEAEQIVANLNAVMADEQKQLAKAAFKAEQIALLFEKDQRERAERERERAEKQKQLAEIAARKEREAKIEEQRKAYIARVGLAAAKIDENAFGAAENLLDGTNALFRNWEWGYLKHLCRQGERDFKSGAPLEGVALMGDGSKFVVVGEQGMVQIRNTENPRETAQTLKLPKDVNVFDVDVSPTGKLIALATNDRTGGYIKLWDTEQQKLLEIAFGNKDTTFLYEKEYRDKLRTRHMEPVTSVEFSQDGSKLLTASHDQTARIWDVKTGNQLVSLPGENTGKNGHFGIVWDAVFCPNPKTDANGKRLPETTVVTVSDDKKALVWVDSTGQWNDHTNIKLLPPFNNHQNPIYAVACSPDGSFIATGGYGRRVLLWQINDVPRLSERELLELQLQGKRIPFTPFRELVGHSGPIRSIDFAITNEMNWRNLPLVTGSDDNTVKVWNVDRQSPLDKIRPIKTFRGHGGYVRDCVFNPQGTWILSVSHDRSAKRWSLADDANTEVYLVNGPTLDGHQDDVGAVAFSPESESLVTASRDNTAQLYRSEGKNKNRWKRVFTLREGHANLIPSAVYFDGGRQLATASYDHSVRVWDLAAGTEKFHLTKTGSYPTVAVSLDGRWILTGSNTSGKAKLWDMQNPNQSPVELGHHSSLVTTLAFANRPNANGQILLATGDSMGRCAVWQWTPRTQRLSEEPRMLVRFDDQKAHLEGIVAVHFLAGDQRLLTAGREGTVTQWNLANAQAVKGTDLRHPAGVTSFCVTPDGKRAVTTCNDTIVRLWNLEANQTVREFRPFGFSETLLTNVQRQFQKKTVNNQTLQQAWELFQPNADVPKFLKQGGWNQSVAVLMAALPDHLDNLQSPPRELAQKLAALFDNVTAEDLLSASTSSAAISPDGFYIAVANRTDDIVHVWRLPKDANSNVIASHIDDNRQVSAVVFSPLKIRTEMAVLGFSDARPWRLITTAENRIRKAASIPMNPQDDVASAEFSADGKYIVTAARDKAARVWSVDKGRAIVKLQGDNGHTDAVNIGVWAPEQFNGNGGVRHILTAGDDAQTILWKLTPTESGFQAEVVRAFKNHSAAILDAAFSPRGNWFVTVASDGALSLWDTNTNQQPLFVQKQADPLLCVSCSQDGREILTGSKNNQAIIWSVIGKDRDMKLKPALLLEGHSARVTDVAFSPLEDIDGDGKISNWEKEGQRAVTASHDNTVIVWDTRIPDISEKKLPDASQVLTLKRHNRPVNAVRFSPNGRYILTGSEDHRAIVWPTVDWLSAKRAAYQKYLEEKKLEPKEKRPLTVSTSLLTN